MKKLLAMSCAATMFAVTSAQAEDAYVCSTNVTANGSAGTIVNIGYCMKATSRIEVDFQYLEVPTRDVLFGAWGDTGNSSATPGLRMACWNNGGVYSFILDSGSFKNYPSSVALDTKRHTAVIDAPNREFKLYASDGTSEWSGSVDAGRTVSGEADWPIVLFGCSVNAAGKGNQYVKAKIYSVKIYETENGVETLVRDLVPCLKNDDVGFYDNTSDVFYHGQSTLGGLVCGGDNVKTIKDAYLETPSSNKTVEKISFNTGYFMKTNSWLAVDFQWLGTPADLLFGAWDTGAALTTAFWSNGGKLAFLYNPTGGVANYEAVANNNNRHTAIIDARDGSLRLLNRFGDVEYTKNTGVAAVNNAAWPIVLFGAASNASGTGKQFSYARIFSAKFYEGDNPNPVKDFEPYVKDGAAGFMEKVSGTFSEVKGVSAGGDFEYTKSSYVENDGTTALNLGYLANMSSRIEVDYQSLNDAAGKVVFGSWAAGSLRYAFWSDSKAGNKLKFIFHGKSSNDPQYVTSSVHDKLRHTAIVDMKNQMMYYITGSTTNYSGQATAGTFNDTDASTIPLCVYGYINTSGNAAMQAKARVYSVRIYEDEELIHEFLPYTDGTTNSLRDVITGHIATKVTSNMADPAISGIGVDGVERWFVTPQNATVSYSKVTTLKAMAAGAVLRYEWTRNGEAISGGANGELEVAWRKTKTPDVYAVTAVYSLAGGGQITGEPKTVIVTNAPQGMVLVIR